MSASADTYWCPECQSEYFWGGVVDDESGARFCSQVCLEDAAERYWMRRAAERYRTLREEAR